MTYSIVARDSSTGELGVAVQSHWFSVGSIVPWARPGVGAVAIQSVAGADYGVKLLDLICEGAHPKSAISALLATGEGAEFRQIGAVDAEGRASAHTGSGCIVHAGDVGGDGFSAQANMMATAEVWPAMASAFEAASGALARRLMAALEAAQGAGGDLRGRQSAAVLVVPASGREWERSVDLRVDDGEEPLVELGRLLDLHDAYTAADEADELAAQGRHEDAAGQYLRACELAPEKTELAFWAGLAMVQRGEADDGVRLLTDAISRNEGLRELLVRLEPEMAPGAPEARRAMGIGS